MQIAQYKMAAPVNSFVDTECAIPPVNLVRMGEININHEVLETACSSDTRSLYTVESCQWAGHTGFSETVIAKSPVYGNMLFLDGELQSAEADEALYHEHLVHPALNAAAANPNKAVLIVGGGEGATAREVLKWRSVGRVFWVDIDGPLVHLCRRYLNYADDSVYNDPRLHLYAMDIRDFFDSHQLTYDVIILDLPDPDVDALERTMTSADRHEMPLYGPTFMARVREALRPGGVLVSHAGPIAPGGDPTKNRSGLTWFQKKGEELGFGKGYAYHTCIPSFQSEWGFWMNAAPNPDPSALPTNLRVFDIDAQEYAFKWPRFWESPYIGSHL